MADHMPRQRVRILDATAQDARSPLVALLESAMGDAGFIHEDALALLRGISDGTYRALLWTMPDGHETWLVEHIEGVTNPHPVLWTLPMWRSRRYSTPCGACGHYSEDTIVGCGCACHDLFAGILNS